MKQVKKSTALADLRSYRRTLQMTQQVFWSRFGVNQSSGCRYELGGTMTLPVAILIVLREQKTLSEDRLSKAGAWLASGESKVLADIAKFRRELGLTQTEFWAPLGLTQSAGSRYESGHSLPSAVSMLLILRERELITDKQMRSAMVVVKATRATVSE